MLKVNFQVSHHCPVSAIGLSHCSPEKVPAKLWDMVEGKCSFVPPQPGNAAAPKVLLYHGAVQPFALYDHTSTNQIYLALVTSNGVDLWRHSRNGEMTDIPDDMVTN